ncbi:major capsid protein P2 [Vibrio sp. SCSIO 43137]|uniref:major capsid protein P2 n=1 Tax=Vibrio sp. SCSIO 43137 TaxID=3021011 RepID=UPI002306E1D8|nr:major capsid protein P2 [Vibrio sp. SCSIO 43137]WCE31107.1 major capsid protein P2 [Vibrio sp. SCSIO 43137]
MGRLTTKNASFNNVAPGSTAVLTFPVGGLSYHETILKFENMSLAQMTDIKLKINGHTFQEWKDGERLNSDNKHYKRGAATANMLPLYFIRPEMDNVFARRMFAIGTADVSTMSLHITIADDAVNPKLDAWTIHGDPAPLDIITRKLVLPFASSTGGKFEVSNIPIDTKGAAIAAIHIYSADVDGVTLKRNNETVFELERAMAAKVQTDYGRDPQSADKLSLDFILEGDIAQAIQLDKVNDFRLTMDLAKATSGDIVVEYIENGAQTILG